MTEWVVTYTIEFDAPFESVMVAEFYRGEFNECMRIKANSGGGEHDALKTKRPWQPIIGPAREWDELMRSN